MPTGEARRFYESLSGPVLVGMETSGNTLWFERLLEKLGHQLQIGGATAIRAASPRHQKCDPRDARNILQLLLEKRDCRRRGSCGPRRGWSN